MTPTTRLLAVRRARPLADYPRLARVPEPPIVDVVRVARCACGGEIAQLAYDDVPTLVEHHNGTTLHQRWRWAHGRR